MYCPIVYALLFGADVWKAELSMHLSSFKTNTIKVCESTAFHGMSSIQVVQLAGVFELLFAFPSVYVGSFDFRTEQLGDGACFRSLEHSSDNAAASANVPTEDDNGHVCNSVAHEGDHNATSQTSTRVGVCSTSRPSTEVTRAAPDSNNHNNTGSEDPSSCVTTIPISKGVRNGYGCTVYPIWQPIGGFHNNNEFHAYMKQRYPERALALGLPRPLYEIPEHLLYRAQPGEVLVHKSHAEPGLPQPIHAEANPCPDRYLYVLDFYNIINRSEDRLLPSSEVPEARILEQMGALSDATSARYAQRLLDVRTLGEKLFDMADNMVRHVWVPVQLTPLCGRPLSRIPDLGSSDAMRQRTYSIQVATRGGDQRAGTLSPDRCAGDTAFAVKRTNRLVCHRDASLIESTKQSWDIPAIISLRGVGSMSSFANVFSGFRSVTCLANYADTDENGVVSYGRGNCDRCYTFAFQ
eukprot:m.262183 g.262183  ORF g.262183 m.262183 type:complete len:466 (+) comp19697_c0_seq47:862-2259(+)